MAIIAHNNELVTDVIYYEEMSQTEHQIIRSTSIKHFLTPTPPPTHRRSVTQNIWRKHKPYAAH